MVHDPRVSTLLSRLGGLYRDPSRVDRDASSLLKSSVGVHLTPGIAPLVENNGDSSHCLVLQGTIAIVFRGQTYQLLVDIYLPSGYPIRPPVSYVRLAENMVRVCASKNILYSRRDVNAALAQSFLFAF